MFLDLKTVEQVRQYYIDPGTGMIVLQMIIATAVTLPFVVKTFGRKVVEKLRKYYKQFFSRPGQ